jgi:hypothetical protein
MVFPEPAENVDDDEEPISDDLEEHTFAIDPQERSRVPLAKHAALEEPLGRFPVVKIVRDVVICRWIGGNYPFSETLSRLIPCEHVKDVTARTMRRITNISSHLRYSPIVGPFSLCLFRLTNARTFSIGFPSG